MTKILIVEDEAVIGDLLSRHLVSQGYDVCGVVESLAEALTTARAAVPDIAVVDLRLAGGDDGRQVARELSLLPRPAGARRLGVLYASASPDAESLKGAVGDACLRKPYRLEEVSQAIEIINSLVMGRDLPELIPPRLVLLPF